MKILYIITKSNWGGAQRHVFDLATHAKKNGQDVVVALGGEGELRHKLREAGITTRPISHLVRDTNLRKDIGSFADILKLVKEERPDILHLHSTKAGGIGALAGRLHRVNKIIFTAHGWVFNEERPFIQKSLILLASWVTMLLCTHIITISETEYNQASAFPLVRKKLRLIRLGINPPIFYSATSAIQFFQTKTSTSLSKKYIMGTIAELHPNKGLIYTINALHKLTRTHPNFLFFIIGEGEQKPHLEALVKEKGLEQHIHFLGYIPNAAEYLRGWNLFLLSSIKEGLPYVLIEAGFAGIPVVATTVGGIPELVSDMETGILVQSKKSEEICHALEFLIEHKNTQREYARNFQERVKKMFNLEQMLTSIFRIYAEPTEARRPSKRTGTPTPQ